VVEKTRRKHRPRRDGNSLEDVWDGGKHPVRFPLSNKYSAARTAANEIILTQAMA
jgi:hypothetical protein